VKLLAPAAAQAAFRPLKLEWKRQRGRDRRILGLTGRKASCPALSLIRLPCLKGLATGLETAKSGPFRGHF
jgi:hypothetical protein